MIEFKESLTNFFCFKEIWRDKEAMYCCGFPIGVPKKLTIETGGKVEDHAEGFYGWIKQQVEECSKKPLDNDEIKVLRKEFGLQ